jgi:hypothetical protein
MVARALIVTITEGVGLLPQAAFLSSALRELGFETRLLATDFCTTQDGFQTEVKEAMPDVVVFIDAVEWREILVTLTGFACETTPVPVLLSTTLPAGEAPAGFPSRVRVVQDGDLAALADAAGVRPKPIDLGRIGLDYALFGGAPALDRAMATSLFGDTGTVALLAQRVAPKAASGTAALARLEGAVPNGPVSLAGDVALRPLTDLGAAVRQVEWWDRRFDAADHPLLEAVWRTGLRQSVRLAPEDAKGQTLADLKARGVYRVVFDCEAASPAAVVAAIGFCHGAGLQAGALLVIGIPGETWAITAARCEALREVGIDRVRVVPFEPAGGTETLDRCVAKGWWPPKDHRWNRELYQPLEQPEAAEYAKVLEEALMLVADVEARCGAAP